MGYIYIRYHKSYKNIDDNGTSVYKVGKTLNIPDRDSQYATNEPDRGIFIHVYEVDDKILDTVDIEIKIAFKLLNYKSDGGTEFYYIPIEYLIEPLYFIKNNIPYKKLTNDEINNLVRTDRINYQKPETKLDDTKPEVKPESKPEVKTTITYYTPKDYQLTIINKVVQYFQYNDKGMLIIPCGAGKTLISLWVTQMLNYNKIIIGVPSILLLYQWYSVVRKLFNNIPYLLICGNNKYDINNFLMANEKCIVLTTYNSSNKVYDAIKLTSYKFDMIINDEAHHLTTVTKVEEQHNAKKYTQMLLIPSKKQLSLTATLKLIEYKHDHSTNLHKIISNDNINYFGNIIEKKCLLWAINNKVICDYDIHTIITDEKDIDEKMKEIDISDNYDKKLFLSAFSALMSMSNCNSCHILIYANSIENSVKINDYISKLLSGYFKQIKSYNSSYNSNISNKERSIIMDKFKSVTNGILTSVYTLGEGYDLPLLDSVVFAENMTSNIRIVQSALRPCRLNSDIPNKKAKIIIPILNYNNEWLNEPDNDDFKKLSRVIYEMGLEDITINHKIKFYKSNIKKTITHNNESKEFIEYDSKLVDKMRLKIISRISYGLTYNAIKKILANLKLKSKVEYYNLILLDCRLPADPETEFKGKFTNWCDYLSITDEYYNLIDCKKECNKLLIKHSYLNGLKNITEICNELCKLDIKFPPVDLWADYYKTDLSKIIDMGIKKKRNEGL